MNALAVDALYLQFLVYFCRGWGRVGISHSTNNSLQLIPALCNMLPFVGRRDDLDQQLVLQFLWTTLNQGDFGAATV